MKIKREDKEWTEKIERKKIKSEFDKSNKQECTEIEETVSESHLVEN